MISGLENKITVYHGSTSLIETIDVAEGKPYKDFGRGFYVTESELHARNIAIRNKRIEKERFSRDCEAYLYTYEMDMPMLYSFSIKEFQYADMEWLQFVVANRKTRNRTHGYDVVIGPTANDDTMAVINAYLDALYGEIGTDDALRTLLNYIEPEKLPRQIFFSNNEATGILVMKRQVVIA